MAPGAAAGMLPSLAIKEMRIKEEPEEPKQAPSESVEIPPGVVLEKLEELLEKGRVMLRYQPPTGKAWGINGIVDGRWLSFRMEANGVCQFADEEIWLTEDRESWAESELETLAGLRDQAFKYPACSQVQPRAWRPRACRRAVFNFHRTKHKKAPPAKAKALAGQAAAPKMAPTAKVAAKPATNGAEAVKVVEEIEDDDEDEEEDQIEDEGGAESGVEDEEPSPPVKVPAKAPLVKAALAKAPQAKVKLAPPQKMAPSAKANGSAQKSDFSFQQFMASARCAMVEAGEQSKYVRLLKAVQSCADTEATAALLAGYTDLEEQFRRLKGGQAKAKVSAPRQPSHGGAAKDPPKTVPAGQAAAAPAPKAQEAINKFREEELKSLRSSGAEQTHQFVKLVCGARGVRASTRMTLLRYVQQKSSEQAQEKRLTILRGAPGSGKSSWALESLRTEVGILDGEENIAQLAHICSSSDFFTKCKGRLEQYKFEATFSDRAHATNQARVQVAMELGIAPLYVDNANMQLWEMNSYVRMAQNAGYEVSVMAPEAISARWDDADALLAQDSVRGETARGMSKEQLQEMLNAYEALPDDADDQLAAILAGRCAGSKGGGAPPEETPAQVVTGVKRSAGAAGLAAANGKVAAKAPSVKAAGPKPAGIVVVTKRPLVAKASVSLPAKAKAKAARVEPPPAEEEVEVEEDVDADMDVEEEVEQEEEEVEVEREALSLGAGGGEAETSFVSSFLSSLRKKPKV